VFQLKSNEIIRQLVIQNRPIPINRLNILTYSYERFSSIWHLLLLLLLLSQGKRSFLNLHIHIYKQGIQLQYERHTVPPKQSFTICAQYCEKLCTVVRFYCFLVLLMVLSLFWSRLKVSCSYYWISHKEFVHIVHWILIYS